MPDQHTTTPDQAKALIERLRESAKEVESFPHPSHCEHLHQAFAVMREAATTIENLLAEREGLIQEAENRLRNMMVVMEENTKMRSALAAKDEALREVLHDLHGDQTYSHTVRAVVASLSPPQQPEGA